MQLLIKETMPRRPRPKKDTVAITFRISPNVKRVIAISAQEYGRSENQQTEFLLKVGYLNTAGIETNQMNDKQILEKFEEISEKLVEQEDETEESSL